MTISLIYSIGLIWVLLKLRSILMFFYLNIFKRSVNLLQRYGEKSYAVITGGSDGIGKEFAHQLAKLGFNLCLIARDQDKLNETAEEIKKDCKDTRIFTLVRDFTKSYQEDFFDDIRDKLKDMDVSILVNNVGVLDVNKLHEADEKELRELIIVNCIPIVMMSRVIIPQMLKRKNHGAIINVSSIAGKRPYPHEATYSASKVFDEFFSLALQQEIGHRIDVMSLCPGSVSTKMTHHKTPDSHTSTTYDTVRGALKDLGRGRKRSYGSCKHLWHEVKYDNMPTFLQRFLWKRESVCEYKSEKKEEGEVKGKGQEEKKGRRRSGRLEEKETEKKEEGEKEKERSQKIEEKKEGRRKSKTEANHDKQIEGKEEGVKERKEGKENKGNERQEKIADNRKERSSNENKISERNEERVKEASHKGEDKRKTE